MTFQLRCDRCGGALDQPAMKPMQLLATVKRSLLKQDLELDPEQVARRCRGCGFVNIFVPLREKDVVASL